MSYVLWVPTFCGALLTTPPHSSKFRILINNKLLVQNSTIIYQSSQKNIQIWGMKLNMHVDIKNSNN